jgi:hypothetical protein
LYAHLIISTSLLLLTKTHACVICRAAGTEILDALAGLLALEQLPISALWAAGYLLLQLAAFGRGGAELTPLQAQNVQHAWGRARDGIMDQMRGPRLHADGTHPKSLQGGSCH